MSGIGGIGPRARQPRMGPPFGFVPAAWAGAWIWLFAVGDWRIALPMVLLTGPVSALGWRWRRAAKRSRRAWAAVQPAAPAPRRVPAASSAPSPEVALERRMTASVIRAESSAARLDADALALVRELADRLGPLLARSRQPGVDAGVRHDVEAIVAHHLPAVLDAYLALPTAALRAPGADGRSPADTLRSQLLLLSEGSRELEQAIVRADLSRQQELGRFLDAKFRRSDLDI